MMTSFPFLVLILCIPFYKGDARSNRQLERQQSFTISQDLKSITAAHNDYDCVDIYKQPAFEHPLLKNHSIQLKPTSTRNILQSRSSYTGKDFKIDKLIKGCPQGKVPIHKKKIKDQMSTKSSSKSQMEDFDQYSQSYPGHHFATIETTQNTTFHGASAFISAYNLSMQANQHSFSQIWLQSGPPTELNSIQVGLAVHPSLYGDSHIRITSYWTADGYKNGCFNILCPGFIQVHSDLSLGSISPKASIIGSNQYDILFNVKQDQLTGHWWLSISEVDIQIGYWPKEIFTHLSGGSSLIRYGGETFAPPNMISPPMGSGRLPQELFHNSSHISNLEIVDSDHNKKEVNYEDMKLYIDTSSNCYDLLYHGYQGHFYKQVFLFGGPGGKCGI